MRIRWGNIKVKPQYDEVIDFNIEPLQFAKTPPHSYYYVRKDKEIFLIDANNNSYFEEYDFIKSPYNERGILMKKN
uniref:Uncharacterized protein n=1 Tax=Chryseobacterium endophyticum TaxID=1854762 RepID=A0AAU6WJU6_9FLAO